MPNKVYMNWEDITRATLSCLPDMPEKIYGIIAIARGGLIPATILAHHYGCKNILTLNALSYDDTSTQQQRLTIVNGGYCAKEAWQAKVSEQGAFILVDDIIDTGVTALAVANQFKGCISHFVCPTGKPKGIEMFRKNCPEMQLDIGTTFKNDEWVVFPWESDAIIY